MDYVEINGNEFEIAYDGILSLPECGIKNINEIKGLNKISNIKYLYLEHNEITEIKGLEHLTMLQILRLDHNNINEIKGLKTLTNLQELRLDHNNISDIKGLDSLTNLKDLQLNHNIIIEIKGLSTLSKLQYLSLNHNKIKEINNINKLVKLEGLYLQNNQMSLIKGLHNLSNLRALSLSNNKITQIKGLDNLRNLDTLWLENNRITNIEGMENLLKLRLLYLTNNPIPEKTIDSLGGIREGGYVNYPQKFVEYCKNQLGQHEIFDFTEQFSESLLKFKLKKYKRELAHKEFIDIVIKYLEDNFPSLEIYRETPISQKDIKLIPDIIVQSKNTKFIIEAKPYINEEIYNTVKKNLEQYFNLESVNKVFLLTISIIPEFKPDLMKQIEKSKKAELIIPLSNLI